MNEIEWVQWLQKHTGQQSSIGDDAAILEYGHPENVLLFCCDSVIEGVHYTPNEITPFHIGWKTACRALSDIAAMGGIPQWCTLAMGIRRDLPQSFLDGFYEGLTAAGRQYGVPLVGGDTSCVKDAMFFTASVLGIAPKQEVCARNGVRIGDRLMVTGRLGGSQQRKHYTFSPRIQEARLLVKNFDIGGMIDISDGLCLDAYRLACASHVHIVLEEQHIPVSADALQLSQGDQSKALLRALHDGEDFELLFSIKPELVSVAQELYYDVFHSPLYTIGFATAGVSGIDVLDADGCVRKQEPHGFDHFLE